MLAYVYGVILLSAVGSHSQEDNEPHTTINVITCISNSTEAEDEQQVDGNELFYVDFDNSKMVMTLPDFGDSLGVVPEWVQQAKASRQICINNLDVHIQVEKSQPEQKDRPHVVMYPKNDLEMDISNTLICFVTGFYPVPVKLSWYKNEQLISNNVEFSRYYPNSDFTFQMFSRISFIPKLGDIYSCQVEHVSLKEPATSFWEPEMKTQSDAGKTVFCAIGLAGGLLGVAIGTFFLIKGNNCN